MEYILLIWNGMIGGVMILWLTSCRSVVKHDEKNVGWVKECQADQKFVEKIGLKLL